MTDKIVYGRLILPQGVRDAGLWIQDDKIAGIVAPDQKISDAEIIDYGGKYILPGLIEVHGHMREPGLSHKEDYPHGTSAAVAGGVTTIFDMPNTVPPTTTIQRLREKEQIAAGRAYCDYAMIFGGARDNQDEIAKLDPSEVVGVKFFMAGHETTPTTVTDLGDLYAGLRAMQDKDLVALFHAENQSLINRMSAEMKAAGRDDGLAYSESRRQMVAIAAIGEAIALAKDTDVPAYICHISTRAEVALIQEAKARGINVYAEAVGYHLIFSTDDYELLGTLIKVSPPVRGRPEPSRLRMAMSHRQVDTLASEHSPHAREEKTLAFSQSASGTPGIQENLAMVITEWFSLYRGEPLETHNLNSIILQVAQLGCTNVAEIFGIADRKGSLEVGKDADFTILDTDQTWTIQESDLFSKCGWSAYTGRTATCKVVATYLRGEKVYEDGKIIGSPRGKLLRRNL